MRPRNNRTCRETVCYAIGFAALSASWAEKPAQLVIENIAKEKKTVYPLIP
jgi:hypothetical protein